MAVQPLRAGEVANVLVHMPTDGGADGAIDVAFLDHGRALHNGAEAGAQGMLALINITGLGGTAAGPYANDVLLSTGQADTLVTNGTDAITVTATFDVDPDTVEYFIDDVGSSGAGGACTPADPVTVCTVPAVDVGGLGNGEHVVWVHGQDVNGWGFVTGATFTVDKLGPTITGIAMTPAIYNGTNPVHVEVTADSTVLGTGTDIREVRYAVDAAPTASSAILCSNLDIPTDNECSGVTSPAIIPVAGDITLPALSDGTHTLQFIALDSVNNVGNWSTAPAVFEFTADATAPVVSITTAAGVTVASSYPDAVRIEADIVDLLSNVTDGEWWIDDPNIAGINDPGVGEAHQVTIVDALWGDETTEAVYVHIPLGDVVSFPAVAGPDNDVTVYIRGMDAAGNWGSTDSVGFDPTDTQAPQVTLAMRAGADAEVLGGVDVVAFDPGVVANGVTAAEWFIGANPACTGGPAPGSALPITLVPGQVITGSIANGQASGSFIALPAPSVPPVPYGSVLCVRAKDGAPTPNWSSPVSILSAEDPPAVVVATAGAPASGIIYIYAYDPSNGNGVGGMEYFIGLDPGEGSGIEIAYEDCAAPVIPNTVGTVCATITVDPGDVVNIRALDEWRWSPVLVTVTAP